MTLSIGASSTLLPAVLRDLQTRNWIGQTAIGSFEIGNSERLRIDSCTTSEETYDRHGVRAKGSLIENKWNLTA